MQAVSRTILVLLLITLGTSLGQEPGHSGAVSLDVSALLARVRDHQDAIDKLRENFTYTQSLTHIETDKKGKEKKRETKTYQVTFYRHRQIHRLVAMNGKPLSASEAAKDQRRAEDLIKELDSGRTPADPDAGRRLRIATLLRAERFANPRRETFRGRDVIVFDFSPDPQFKPANSNESFYRQMAGSMAVDEADLQVARVEFKLIGAFKVAGGAFFEMKPGAQFLLEQARFFDEVWLPTRSESTFDARAVLFYNFGVRDIIEYSDYGRFGVNTEEKPSSKPKR